MDRASATGPFFIMYCVIIELDDIVKVFGLFTSRAAARDWAESKHPGRGYRVAEYEIKD